MMGIYTGIMASFFSGALIGIIDAWERKIMFFIFLGILIVSIINLILNPTTLAESYFYWWQLPLNIFFVVIGIKCGNIIYENVFDKENKEDN